jgi:hypothetical protein
MASRTPSNEPTREFSIALTLARSEAGTPTLTIQIPPKEMIAYDQELGFTRLRLKGNKVLEVREGTDEIDRLIRRAASRRL